MRTRPTRALRRGRPRPLRRQGPRRNVCFRFDATLDDGRAGRGDHERAERQPTIFALRTLARSIDAREPGRRGHSERVADLAVALATAIGIPIESAIPLREAALLHDLGKVAVDGEAGTGAGGPGPAETAGVHGHPVLGEQMTRGILTPAQSQWVRWHHELFDGTGYPDGLAGEEIPVEARILAVADAWDLLTGRRPTATALAEMEASAGTRFCPTVVDARARLHRAAALSP